LILILPAGSAYSDSRESTQAYLQSLRETGDLHGQRRYAWQLLVELTSPTRGRAEPDFEAWHGEDQVFGRAHGSSTGIRGFARESSTGPSFVPPLEGSSSDAPAVTYTLYNDAAYAHITDNRLNVQAELDRLRVSGAADLTVTSDRSVPLFPRQARVLKTVWWPVAADRPTPLPVWDPERNPKRRGGHEYIDWQRVVAVDPLLTAHSPSTARIEFAGRAFPNARRIGLDVLYHVVIDGSLAISIAHDRGARKASLITLGRDLRAGDYLVLVAAHLASKDLPEWVWTTLWWHDRPNDGPFAADRPSNLSGIWRNYLVQVAFDANTPAAPDGGPHISYNPWLEARFPDGKQGGGTQSNCMACHRRASYPPVSFLPVTRGAPDFTNDPAYGPERLRTSLLWSIALNASAATPAPR
jgi:hypothetical protein